MKNIIKNVVMVVVGIAIAVSFYQIGHRIGVVEGEKMLHDSTIDTLYELEADSAACYTIQDGDSKWQVSRVK